MATFSFELVTFFDKAVLNTDRDPVQMFRNPKDNLNKNRSTLKISDHVIFSLINKKFPTFEGF